MPRGPRFATEPGEVIAAGVALLFFFVWTATSWARWANFAYRTFDLAYYVQALWQLIHGRLEVSVQYVPLLGNHVEPIVFLLAPFFFVFRHPMLFVLLQNAALASMGPVGYRMARDLGFNRNSALLLSGALLVAPATGYVALHEFHPEALTAPFLLLMFQARISGSLTRHWIWFLAVLACKENMAPLLAIYCVLHLAIERRRGYGELSRWFVWPMAVALAWFVLCTKVITPALNAGNIDYVALYDRLGSSGSQILNNAVTKPHLFFDALATSLTQGNLLPALLLPFLGLPLFRPKWLLIASPILLQHLLSWRSSEWTIYFHYAAPLLPLFWIAAVEGVAAVEHWMPKTIAIRTAAPALILAACVAGQFFVGPAAGMQATGREWFADKEARARKQAIIASIPPDASVLAPLPYLSHLAMREQLHSLHYVLKGLRTLSRTSFDPPPPTDFVLLDYGDSATFDPVAGYYHPTMRALGGGIISSSDRLLHEFLRRIPWDVLARNQLTLLRQITKRNPPEASRSDAIFGIGEHTKLFSIQKSGDILSKTSPIEIKLLWQFEGEREVIPWMALRFLRPAQASPIFLQRGLCAPEAAGGFHEEHWQITSAGEFPPGEYQIEALFFDNSKGAWIRNDDPSRADPQRPAAFIPLGQLRVE